MSASPLCLVLLHASGARAVDTDEIRAHLRVERGATCLNAQQLAVAIEPLLDDVPIPEDVLFVVEGSASDARSARLRVEREGRALAERAFEPGPERCDRLHAAVGLAIALAINASEEEPVERARTWSGSGAGLWTYGALPRLAPGLELLARRDLGRHVRLRAGALGIAALGSSLPRRAGTFDAALAGARADGCALARFSPAVRVEACAGLLGGVLYVVGDEVERATADVVPWLAAAAAADLELALSARWSLALGVTGSFLLHRVEVGTEDASGTRLSRLALDRTSVAVGIGPVYYF